jgi:hypothetical protein
MLVCFCIIALIWTFVSTSSLYSKELNSKELMDNAHDVSPIVNSAKYDGPECIQPVSDDETPSGQLSLL